MINADARRYIQAAAQRFTAAELLLNADFNLESMYLAGYVVECSIKCLLLTRTPVSQRDEELAGFRGGRGHDLEALRGSSARRDCHVPRLPRQAVPPHGNLVDGPSIRSRTCFATGSQCFFDRGKGYNGLGQEVGMTEMAAKKRTPETDSIEAALRPSFPSVEAYRQNSASIRVRIIDERFRGMSRIERDDLVQPFLAKLPERAQQDITILLLLAPGEEASSMMNLEFDQPTPSRL